METVIGMLLEFTFGALGAFFRWILNYRGRRFIEVLEDRLTLNIVIGFIVFTGIIGIVIFFKKYI